MAEIFLQTINEAARRAPAQLIAEADDSYRAQLDAIAQSIAQSDGVRVVLLAGPSGSGKTTTANMLRDRLIARGHPSAVVSLDHFYRNRDEHYPLNPDGSYDYENVTALQTELLTRTLLDIIAQRDCALPHYDFKTSTRRDGATPLPARPGEAVIIEGLHALNPLITDPLPQANVRKLFISVSTNVNRADGTRLLSGRKVRFLRRMTRDYLYRGADAAHTLALWPNVIAGEERYLYPYRGRADHTLNTFHRYEVGVLRHYAEAMLAARPVQGNSFLDAVMAAVRQFAPIAPELVPQTALIREFIPGGVYEELY